MKLSVLVRLVPVAALLLAGCESLPPGVPPQDDIVKNDPPAGELSPRKAENLLITALGLYTLREMPGIGIALNSDQATLMPAARILKGMGAMSGVRFDSQAQVELRSSAAGNSWNFELFDRKSKTVLWHEEVPVVMNGQDR